VPPYSSVLGFITTSLIKEQVTPAAQNSSAMKWFLLYLTFKKVMESTSAEGIEKTCNSITDVIDVNSKALTTKYIINVTIE
jgi:hypothetical protein